MHTPFYHFLLNIDAQFYLVYASYVAYSGCWFIRRGLMLGIPRNPIDCDILNEINTFPQLNAIQNIFEREYILCHQDVYSGF